MAQALKLSQALKRVRGGRKPGTLIRRIQTATEEIQKYSAKPSNEKSVFGDEAKQRAEVAQRQQAIKDLVLQALKTHAALDLKNLTTPIKTSMGEFTIADLIRLKRTYLPLWRGAYDACDTGMRHGKIEVRGLTAGSNPVTVEPMFDEQERNEMLQQLRAFDAEIDELLDAVNNDERHTVEIPD